MENSPLHVAILNNQVQIAEMLVDAKIDVLMLNKEQSTCHDLAQNMELEEMCEYLDPVIVRANIW